MLKLMKQLTLKIKSFVLKYTTDDRIKTKIDRLTDNGTSLFLTEQTNKQTNDIIIICMISFKRYILVIWFNFSIFVYTSIFYSYI
jgi:hypothetical protein